MNVEFGLFAAFLVLYGMYAIILFTVERMSIIEYPDEIVHRE